MHRGEKACSENTWVKVSFQTPNWLMSRENASLINLEGPSTETICKDLKQFSFCLIFSLPFLLLLLLALKKICQNTSSPAEHKLMNRVISNHTQQGIKSVQQYKLWITVNFNNQQNGKPWIRGRICFSELPHNIFLNYRNKINGEKLFQRKPRHWISQTQKLSLKKL